MAKIIIVEDDPMISEIYQKKFSDSGFEVLAADSGDRVLELARKEAGVDAVLLDLIMPKMDGFEVIKNLRDGSYDSNIKIIVFSNLSQREDRDKALKLGANGFVIKSEYSPSELVQEVNRLLLQFSEQKRNTERETAKSQGEEGVVSTDENGKKKILLIEDEDVFIDMFGGKLEQEGFKVVSARNGAWGYKEALKENFDLLIIDMAMPAMNGDEIIERLKLDETKKNTPIIVLSASSTDEDVKKVKALGINGFFVKTQITPLDLFKKVEEIVEE